MTCIEIEPLLDDYLDGTLPAEIIQEVGRHLAACDRCRAEEAALRALVGGARALPRSVLPERDLWTGIEARLAPAPQRTRVLGTRYRPVVLLAAALFLLLAGATLATLYQRSQTPFAFAAEQRRYAAATADLARKLADNPTRLSSTTRLVVERNLAIVDQAIREAETALTTDPDNAELEQMVLARYAQRLNLLKRATEAGKQES